MIEAVFDLDPPVVFKPSLLGSKLVTALGLRPDDLYVNVVQALPINPRNYK